jgi:hypothetical protein
VILPASYSNGFAPRDGQPLYPELWDKCVFAVAPCLGPTGLTLRDWSGGSAHGSLTNGPAWGIQQGLQSITFDGVNDYIEATGIPLWQYNDTFSISVWLTLSATGSQRNIVSTWAVNSQPGWQFIVTSGNKLALYILNNAGTGALAAESTRTLSANQRYHVMVQSENGTYSGIRFWVNGIESTTTNVSIGGGNPGALTATTLRIGLRRVLNDTPLVGSVQDVRIMRSAISRSMSLLALRPGIAYELAARRRSSSAVLFNRRRRLLVGAGS